MKRFLYTVSLPLLLLVQQSAKAQNIPNGSTRPAATAVTAPGTYPSGTMLNKVTTREARGPIGDTSVFSAAAYTHVQQVTQFLDGLGRPLQVVQKQNSPSAKDLVSATVYDAYGREQYKYLPYASTESNGSFKPAAFSSQASFMSAQYPNDSIYYSESRYEASPLNRVLKSLAPGNSWGGSDKGISTDYLINDSFDSVYIWRIGNTALFYNGDDTTNTPVTAGSFEPGTLYETHTTDEHGKQVVEYKDKEGHVVLKKVQIGSSVSNGMYGWLCTYYVYDDFGQLRFVIPPKAVEAAAASSWVLTAEIIAELCFRYEYDARNRMIAKKVPGAGWVYMVYDKRDRLAYTQDANMRAGNSWMTTLYDDLNRPLSTGMITYSGNRDALQAILDANFNVATTTTVSVNFYAPDTLYVDSYVPGKPTYRAKYNIHFTSEFQSDTTANFETILDSGVVSTTPILVNYNPFPPSANFIALTLQHYDGYDSIAQTYSAPDTSLLGYGGNPFPDAIANSASALTRGMTTRTQTRILNNPSNLAAGGWIETVQFYDNKGRLIQTQTENQTNGIDTTSIRYDFTGKPIARYERHHNAAAGQALGVSTQMLYDHAGRLLHIKKMLNNDASTARYIARNRYDELGQLLQKREGQRYGNDTSTTMELQNYSYNIRGWMEGLNKNYSSDSSGTAWFGMQLNYDYGYTTPQLNGNIAGQQWRSRGDGKARSMGYGYDAANRILQADFTQYTSGGWNTNAGIDFSLSGMSYDANGNILTMNQKGWKISGSDSIDVLTYTYAANSNKLRNVVDAVNDTATRLGDFRSSKAYVTALGTPKDNTATDYTYDNNGNLLKDLNKDIGASSASGITYNHLNLPYKVWVKGKGDIVYYYDATGNKLEKRVYDSTLSRLTRTTYIGGNVYSNDTLQFFAHEEGRVRKVNNSFVYDYFLKDHLGNTRMVLTDEAQADVYPIASLESASLATEKLYYDIPDAASVRVVKPTALGYPSDATTSPNDYVHKLNGSGTRIGSSIVLKVMAGDTITAKANSWYKLGSANPANVASPLTDLVSALLGQLPVASGGKIGSGALTGPVLSPSVEALLNNRQSNAYDAGKPKAYLNYLFFDEQMKAQTDNSGFKQVGASEAWSSLTAEFEVTRSGYIYIYVSNESTDVDVYFDNLQVRHGRGPLLEETHYYPFGLTMAGISSKAAGKLDNKKNKFQGQEYNDDLGIDMYEFKWRMDDPQLGRFWQVDPLADKYVYNSIYAFSENKVTNDVELEGLESVPSGSAMNYLSQGFSSMTQVLAYAVDKVTNFFTNTKTEITLPTSSNTSIVTTSSSTTTIGTNFTAWIYGENTGSVPIFRADTKTDSKVEVKTETTKGPVSVSSKVSVDGTSSELKGQVKTTLNGLPITASLSQATNISISEMKTTAKLATGTSGVNGFGQVEIVNTPKRTTTNVSVGVEWSKGATKTSISIGKVL